MMQDLLNVLQKGENIDAVEKGTVDHLRATQSMYQKVSISGQHLNSNAYENLMCDASGLKS